MADEASVKTSAKNCQASNGNNSVSSHSPSVSCMQNIKEQIPKYQVIFVTLLLLFFHFTEGVSLLKPVLRCIEWLWLLLHYSLIWTLRSSVASKCCRIKICVGASQPFSLSWSYLSRSCEIYLIAFCHKKVVRSTILFSVHVCL